MRGWLALIVIVVLVGAGVAVYYNTYGAEKRSAPPASRHEIFPGVPSIEYRDTEFGFSIMYPETATTSEVGFEGFLPRTQTPVVSFVLPRGISRGTNLIEAGIYIGATSTPKVVASCNAPSLPAGERAAGTRIINGTVFSVFRSSGAGTGNFYETKAYRALRGGRCFELALLLHSGTIGNYPEGTVVEFDRATFEGYLDAMVNSFSFI